MQVTTFTFWVCPDKVRDQSLFIGGEGHYIYKKFGQEILALPHKGFKKFWPSLHWSQKNCDPPQGLK